MTEDRVERNRSDPPSSDGEESLRRAARRTRRTAEEIRQRSEEIRVEAERIRSLSMITLINVEVNYRAAQKAYRTVMREAGENDP